MVKIIQRHLSIDGLKVYQEKSPSKWKDKFGDLDLDNIPEEYMKIGQFPNIQQDGQPERDMQGNIVMQEEEYFDAIQYRKDLIVKSRPKTPLIEDLKVQPVISVNSVDTAPDLSPSHIGEAPK